MIPDKNHTEETCHRLLEGPDRSFGLIAIGSFIFEVCGLLGNAVSLLVLISRFLKRDTFRLFLSALCVADMGTLVCAMFMLSVPEIVYSSNAGKDVLNTVHGLVILTFPIGHMLKTCSCWLVAVMSLYRFVYVKYPLLFRKIGSRDIAQAVIACICIVSFLFNLTRMFELKLRTCRDQDGDLISEVGMTELRDNEAYKIVYHGAVSTGVRFILPVVVILFCNCYLLAILGRGRIYWNSSRSEHTSQHVTSVLLVCVSFVFLLCNLFAIIATMIELTIMAEPTASHFLKGFYASATDVSNFLTVANASINFFLYLTFNRKFRSVVVDKLRSIVSAAESSKSGSRTRRDLWSTLPHEIRIVHEHQLQRLKEAQK